MTTLSKPDTRQTRVMWTAVALAIFTALAYVLMAFDVLGVGDLQMDERPAGIIFFAAGCYLLGGLLILVRNRWLLLFGAFINAMVILFFFNMYQERPAVMFSPGGLVSKIAQILLEVALIYVIAVNWKKIWFANETISMIGVKMKYQSALKWLIPLIGILASFAILMGLFYDTPGQPYAITSFRGEKVMINGHGLYYYDTVSTVAQMQGNDIIALFVGLPLLVISTRLEFRGSVRGRLLLTGTLGFFLYTYLSMSMLTAYNMLFLVYVALFTMSLYAFILCMLSFDLADLPRHFSEKLPRGWIAGVLFAVGGFLFLAWVGRVVPELLHPESPAALENTTTRVIQALDLALIVPLTMLAGILLLRRSAWGYLLSSVAILKGLTMALAVSTMAINMALQGVPDTVAIMIPFLVLTALNTVMAVLLLRNITENVVAA